MQPTRLLLLAYHFPPVGGAGVQRPTKFALHLNAMGYPLTVITGPGTSRGRWTPQDASLAADVPDDVEIVRLKSAEPSEAGPWQSRAERWLRLTGDWDRWWLAGSISAGTTVRDLRAIYALMPPWTAGEAAAAIARQRGVPWIADMGDPWALDDMMMYPTSAHRKAELSRMRRTLASAAAIVMSTPEAVRRVAEAFPELQEKTLVAIPNGFDGADFEAPPPLRSDGKFRIVHTGYLHTELGRDQHRLGKLRDLLGGSVRGVDVLPRSHVFLLEAIERLAAEDPQLADVVEVHLAGVLSQRDREVAEQSPAVHLYGYIAHNESVALLRSADMLFLPLHDLPSGRRAAIVPGKTYEYLAARRPILAAVPEGDARDILAEAGNAVLCWPRDVDAMANAIRRAIQGDAPSAVPSANVVHRFEYGNVVRQVAEVVEAACTPRWSTRVRRPSTVTRSPGAHSQPRRVLYIAYHFPPIGGAGVQRSLKFVRYLPEFGYHPVVVTGPGELRDRWTPKDPSLTAEIPPEARVVRVAGPEPPASGGWRGRAERWIRIASRWDDWWASAAIDAGGRLEDVDLVHATLSPWSSAIAAAEIAKRLGKPWTVGLRDPWALDEMMVYPSGLHRRLERDQMRKALEGAAAIIMNTPEAAERLVCSFPSFGTKRIVWIPNGYDSSDFGSSPPARSDGKFRIAHTGYLHTELGRKQHQMAAARRLLGGEVAGVDFLTRSHVYLLAAVERLLARSPEFASVLEVHLAGVVSGGDREVAERVPVVRVHGYLSHAESVALLRSADLLFLPMQNLPGGRRATIIPGKTFEYLAAQRPILAAVPDGDARDILRDAGHALLCRPDDVTGMAEAIAGAVARWREGAGPMKPPEPLVRRFERRNLTEELALLFDSVLNESREAVP